MLKRVGVLALLVCGGVGLLHPAYAVAQEYRGWNGYAPQYQGDGRYYRDEDRYRNCHREREWREQERREERQERAWRQHEWREHQRWDNGYYPAPRAYYGYRY